MSVNINVRIRDDQDEKIKKSGVTRSEYTRNAIDYYSIRKQNSLLQHEINLVQNCIDLLIDYRDDLKGKLITEAYDNLYKSDENVKTDEEKSLYKSEENVKKIYKDDEKSLHFVKTLPEEHLYKKDKNVKTMEDDVYFQKLQTYINTIVKFLKSSGFVPEHFLEKIRTETGLSNKKINEFIRRNRNELLSMNPTYSSERIHYEGIEKKSLQKM